MTSNVLQYHLKKVRGHWVVEARSSTPRGRRFIAGRKHLDNHSTREVDFKDNVATAISELEEALSRSPR